MRKVIIVIILLILGLFLYGKYIEINNLKVKEYEIKNENIAEPFTELKIVHFSDVLYNPSDKDLKLNKLVEVINNEGADILVFSGDLFKQNESYRDNDYKLLKDTLKKMNANLFKFAVIGDNDYKYLDNYKDILYESDFTLLDNESKLVFYKDNTPINVIGISNLDNINSLLETDVSYSYTLAITHQPDNLDELSNYDINTILSGHSLGGLINIPYYGGIIKKDGANTYINDYYTLNNTEIFISNGLGNEPYEFRLFNTPSINVYRFKR